MNNNDKYRQNRKKAFGFITLFTLFLLIPVLFGQFDPIFELSALLLLWGPFLFFISKTEKEYRRSKLLYKGDLDEAVRKCRNVKGDNAALDQGIYGLLSCHLTLYNDIDVIQPRYYGLQSYKPTYQLFIYLKYNSETAGDVLNFATRSEIEEFIGMIKSVSPVELTVNEPAGAPTGKELDSLTRKALGNTAADIIQFDRFSAEQIDARANRNDNVLVVKDPDDPMFKNVGIEMCRMDDRSKTVDPDDFFGKVPIVKADKDADDPADNDKIIF